MLLSIKSIIRIRALTRVSQLLNGITSVVSGVLLYGNVGKWDYADICNIKLSAAEQHEIWTGILFCLIVCAVTAAITMFCTFAIEWLDDCIRYRKAAEKRHRARRTRLADMAEMNNTIQTRRAEMNIAVM